jgi:alkaline phosphatase D
LSQDLTRRRFLTAAGAAGAAIWVAPSALAEGVRPRTLASAAGTAFGEGVISGDPTPNGITLWTRLLGAGGNVPVNLEVARDRGFRRVVARRTITARDAGLHAVKARVSKLRPHEQYWYRFSTQAGDSDVGTFRTALPADSNEKVRFAFFSCQEYTFGWFNAHALMARERDLDFVLNLGDYIYEIGFTPPIGVRSGEYTTGIDGPQSYDTYVERYRTARRDASLRAMHAAHPMISTWDDHEVQNDYAGGDPKGGDVNPPYSVDRRNQAYRAWFDSMPTFPQKRNSFRLYHRASFGRLVDLFVLDERQYRAAQPCDNSGKACAGLDDQRAFLGRQQLDFVRSGLTRSRARWKVIANELMIMPVKVNETDLSSFDAWTGYPREREALLRTIQDRKIRDVVFCTGDYHAFIAGDVRTARGRTVATEFVGGSITSASDPEVQSILRTPGYGTPDAPAMPAAELAAQKAVNPWFKELDYLRHGYVVCEASRSTFKATYKKLETIRRQTTALSSQKTYTVRRGRPGL